MTKKVSKSQQSLPNMPAPVMKRGKEDPERSGSDLFIVDNSDQDWKVVNYLREWCGISHQFDIATGYFEIGSLLALDDEWQKLDKIRILMGDEVSRRTRKAFEEGLTQITNKLDDSIEAAKEEDDFLNGVPAIVDAIENGLHKLLTDNTLRQRLREAAKARPAAFSRNAMANAALAGYEKATA